MAHRTTYVIRYQDGTYYATARGMYTTPDVAWAVHFPTIAEARRVGGHRADIVEVPGPSRSPAGAVVSAGGVSYGPSDPLGISPTR